MEWNGNGKDWSGMEWNELTVIQFDSQINMAGSLCILLGPCLAVAHLNEVR